MEYAEPSLSEMWSSLLRGSDPITRCVSRSTLLKRPGTKHMGSRVRSFSRNGRDESIARSPGRANAGLAVSAIAAVTAAMTRGLCLMSESLHSSSRAVALARTSGTRQRTARTLFARLAAKQRLQVENHLHLTVEILLPAWNRCE